MISIKLNRYIFLIIILFLSLLFTTIVYSAFNTQLQIRGEAIVRADQMFRITGLKISKKTDGVYETFSSKFGKDTTSFYVTLPGSTSTSTSSITYEVETTNKNPQIMYRLEEIIPLINDNPNVTVDYSIKQGDCITNNSKESFTITLTNNSSSEQVLTLVTQYKFEIVNWEPLETSFLSSTDSGDLAANKDGVIFEVSVTNLNSFNVDYSLTSDNYRYEIIDDVTKGTTFQIGSGATINHQVRVKLREDVAYEKFTDNLKLMVKTTRPKSSTADIKTVVLNLPRKFNTILLNSMELKDSPESFSSAEDTNGYLFKTNEMTDSSYTYYFRGVINNNYFQFANKSWRIVRIDSNGNIRLVLNDNVSSTSPYSSNYESGSVENIESAISLVDYRKSNVRTAVEKWYNQNIKPNDESKYVVNSKFCIDLSYDGPITTQFGKTVYYFTPYLHVGVDSHNFTPDFTCSNENVFMSPVGLLSAEEVLAAGGYWDTHNSNYYLYNQSKSADSQISWTLSGSYYSTSEKQAGVIVFNQYIDGGNGLFDWVQGGNISQNYGYRPVISININEGTNVLGNGTKDNPYMISNNN